MLISPVLVNSIPPVALEFVTAFRANFLTAVDVCHAPSLPPGGPARKRKDFQTRTLMLIRLFQQAPSGGIWGAAPGVSESLAWTAIISRLFLMNSSFVIIGARNLWRRSEPFWDSGRGTSPRPIKRCEAGGRFQAAKPKPTTTYWGLLKQPDKHEQTNALPLRT
jgi:hypothetical protein